MKKFTRIIKSASLALLLGIISTGVKAQTNNALDFDGVNDYVEIPHSNHIDSILSIQLWVKVTGSSKIQPIITSGQNSSGVANGFGIFDVSGQLVLYVGNGTATPQPVYGPVIPNNTWTNIAAAYDPVTNSARLYVNGSLVADSTIALGAQPNLTWATRIGADNDENAAVSTNYLMGVVDEVSLWSKTLDSAEINSNMNSSIGGSQANLLAHYNFNEGIANGDNTTPAPGVDTLIDNSPNNLTGTLKNFALNGTTSNWVGSGLSLLPINLINFSGTKKDGYNLLQWSTASEQNSSYFEIQRSENGTDFNAIAKVSAAGNSNIIKNYQYNDDQISSSSAIYYYRLNMVDIDGSGKYSSIIFIKNPTSGGLATVYPNPARNQITINVADQSLINTQVLLSDLSGKILQRISLNQTSTQVDISNYVKGIYILKFINGSSIKIVKE